MVTRLTFSSKYLLHNLLTYMRPLSVNGVIICSRGEGGGSDEVWDRGTMLSQLAKRSIRGLVSGLSKAAVCFLKISTLALSVE